jgi:hypothetical protein
MTKKNKKTAGGEIVQDPAASPATEQLPSKPPKNKDSKTPQPSTSALIICRNKYVSNPIVILH